MQSRRWSRLRRLSCTAMHHIGAKVRGDVEVQKGDSVLRPECKPSLRARFPSPTPRSRRSRRSGFAWRLGSGGGVLRFGSEVDFWSHAQGLNVLQKEAISKILSSETWHYKHGQPI